ncbi:MBL fold metallo-hydrolase [Arthrobacter sp. zg-Y820]|uniref:MBL fold metallo-hydrolase n=1 Tax=unclassified Arthrobacter TaxID=235627 RepID=UPI001E579BD2|nr:MULTISPECIES: MBL fold metallo-hydrolase [unclassified Arthrobacter]MCC9195268.1 MBL fold metallo-hydrolase [Arthrobacter sp. zg-Y820]MDK1278127.1 MBL fold metallo-hydrolase [Arthrobacter sp. zg.Y820]MDK1361395.1 MBL fold metallo-hydrolase [Arthrobacter sp. zg-Y1219]WIB10016.1 MBL fold metallo-hydrolase [Arthrobacter sp. zg-Y820]
MDAGVGTPKYAMTEPAANVFFVEGPASNWIILRDGDAFTLIDGGYPGDLPLVVASIRDAGLDPADAAAILVTHAHADHAGTAGYFAAAYRIPVLCSLPELPYLQGEQREQVSVAHILSRAWNPAVLHWAWHALAAGGAGRVAVLSAATWYDDAELAALPGSPVAVPTPGHTPGHTAYYLPAAHAVATGDALVTGHNISRIRGPQMLDPMFHSDGDGARRSLGQLSILDASLLLPGHGPAARLEVRQAVGTVRSRVAPRKRRIVAPGPIGGVAEPTYGKTVPDGAEG